MRVLVTGGAGYIGSTVAQHLLDAGHAVTVFDDLSSGHRAAVPAAAGFVQGSTLDRDALDAVLDASPAPFDAILHFAAFIEAGESMLQPGRFFRNNVAGSLALLEAAAAHGVQRFVFSSTAGVYASKDSALAENDPLGPVNVYAATKLMVEQALEWYHRIRGLRVAVLRYFNAAGATCGADAGATGGAAGGRGEAHRPETHLIPLVLQVALGRRPQIAIFGDDYPTRDGTCIRDYIHIADLASAHVLALDALAERPFMRYNLGNGSGYSVREVIETASAVTGRPIPAEVRPRRAGDPAILIAGSDAIRRDLGWQPARPGLGEIVESAWRWHVGHPDGYGD